MTAWDISTAVYLQNFNVAAREASPRGIYFKPDGTKMYISGTAGQEINEYTLNTPWDISTAVWVRLLDVSAREAWPQGLSFSIDGSKMYTSGNSGVEVNEWSLGTPWNIATAGWVRLFDLSPWETTPSGIDFKLDGAEMYIVGDTGDGIDQFHLSTPWNIATAAWVRFFSLAGQETSPQGVFFKPDGAKMYTCGMINNRIYEYDLSTPWNIATAVFLQSFDVTAQDGSPVDLFFNPIGTKMYMVGADGQDINEYDLPVFVGTNMQVNISDVLKDISEIKINIGGVLKDVTEAKINISDVLKDVF